MIDRSNGRGAPFDELSTVKIIGENVLMIHTICASKYTVDNNLKWRVKTFNSLKKKAVNVAEDYSGGIAFEDDIHFNDPHILDLDEQYSTGPRVLVCFSAKIPIKLGRKELN